MIFLTCRFSALTSSRLKDNNPNLTDLSDPYRPAKIGEMFSELYDNQWTDAYDELTESMAEVDAIRHLNSLVMVFSLISVFMSLEHIPTIHLSISPTVLLPIRPSICLYIRSSCQMIREKQEIYTSQWLSAGELFTQADSTSTSCCKDKKDPRGQ